MALILFRNYAYALSYREVRGNYFYMSLLGKTIPRKQFSVFFLLLYFQMSFIVFAISHGDGQWSLSAVRQ